MWTDTHLHLDALEYNSDRSSVLAKAHHAQVHGFVLPAVHVSNFAQVQALAQQTPGAVYTLGIHPLYVMQSPPEDLNTLRQWLEQHHQDPKFAGIGEIGLDGFVKDVNWEVQWQFFTAQLRLAREFNCPVVLHVRKAQDQVLKALRQHTPCSGIAHAFNGSLQQAEQFMGLGLKLGFGGACTYPRALQLRRLASTLPWEALVLETDGPDIPPAWVQASTDAGFAADAGPDHEAGAEVAIGNKRRSEPSHLAGIAACVAMLRGCSLETLSLHTQNNARVALPALSRA